MAYLSLRTRLLASYLLLMAITLGIISTAFLLLLSTRPAPTQPTYNHLLGVAQGLNLERYLPRERPTVGDLNDALAIIADEQEIRVIALLGNVILFDSADVFARNSPSPLVVTYRQQRRGNSGNYENVEGVFDDPDGTEWLFVGSVVGGGPIRPITVVLADTRPTTSLVESLRDLSTQMGIPLLQAALVGLAVALALAFYISRSIAGPLQHVAQAAAGVAEGHYDQRVPVSGPPEVRAVGEAFNKMSAEVVAQHTAQRDFLANVSHDLKTPLTSIQGYSQAIVDGTSRNPPAAAQIIYEEATRLNRMVVELTDLARIQAGRLSMQSVALDIGEMTAAIAQRLSLVAQRKHIQMIVKADSMPHIAGDGDRLAQVLDNLISNAIKYTPEGGTVTIETRVARNGVEVVVSDTGIGIPEEDLPRVFERFYQIDKARGPTRGTGLGLAITSEIVQAHGGTITVMSAGDGRGTTFVVWLPSPQMSTVIRRR